MAAADQKQDDNKLNLFSPVKIGGFERPNRIALAPLTRGRATEAHVPTEPMKKYYSQRADSALVITAATGISSQGLGWYRAPGAWNDEQTEAWKPIVEEVHKNKGLFALQLWHMGRQAHSDVTGVPIVSASDIALPGQVTTNKGVKKDYETPHPLDEKEIEDVIKDYANAAANGIKAGFDLVEIHSANGYLIDQFLQSCSNVRQDSYGGSIENRMRFMQQVYAAVLEAVGGDAKKVGIRLSPNGNFGGMGSDDNLELFDAVIEWLSKQGLAYIHIMDGLGFGFHEKTAEPYTLRRARDIIDKIDKSVVIIGNVGYTKDLANERIGAGDADIIAFGRPYISNPDLVTRFRDNIELAETAPYPTWWGWELNEEGYTDWPTAAEAAAKAAEEPPAASNGDAPAADSGDKA